MGILDKVKAVPKEKRMLTAITLLGTVGLLLIAMSSLFQGGEEKKTDSDAGAVYTAEEYRIETEKRLEKFLGCIEGAGEVKVYLTAESGERYIYATENKRSRSDDRLEEEEKYVMTGSGSEKNALVETVEVPSISGAVIACSGCDSPAVQERIYKSASAALDIPTGKIYVTKLG